MTAQPRILLIDDDASIGQLLAESSETTGLSFDFAPNGKLGLEKALVADYDLVLLDLHMPLLDGFEVCRLLRDRKPFLPIIMVTSSAKDVDKVLGLELGADDYVVKPFSLVELFARINAHLRRAARYPTNDDTKASSSLTFGGLTIDLDKRTAHRSGQLLKLSPTEFDLLVFFAKHPGKSFSRDDLMAAVWGFQASRFDPTVTTTISRLRLKLEAIPGEPKFILTVPGFGYRFTEEQELKDR